MKRRPPKSNLFPVGVAFFCGMLPNGAAPFSLQIPNRQDGKPPPLAQGARFTQFAQSAAKVHFASAYAGRLMHVLELQVADYNEVALLHAHFLQTLVNARV